MSHTGPLVARKVRYTGRVQGVGFRATAEWIARSHQVTGWVRNRSDGTVELLVEGSPIEVERFLQAIRDRWDGSIDREDVETVESTGGYSRFETRR